MKQRASNRSIIVGLALLGAGGAWYLHERGDDSADSEAAWEAEHGKEPGLVADRVWVDSRPEKYTDYTHVMLVVTGAPIGLFQKASSYQANIELFEYKRRDATLWFHFPQTGKKRETKFRIRECNDLPPFDLCLDLDSNPWGGPRRYYGMLEQDEERAELGELRQQLEQRIAGARAPGAAR